MSNYVERKSNLENSRILWNRKIFKRGKRSKLVKLSILRVKLVKSGRREELFLVTKRVHLFVFKWRRGCSGNRWATTSSAVRPGVTCEPPPDPLVFYSLMLISLHCHLSKRHVQQITWPFTLPFKLTFHKVLIRKTSNTALSLIVFSRNSFKLRPIRLSYINSVRSNWLCFVWRTRRAYYIN